MQWQQQQQQEQQSQNNNNNNSKLSEKYAFFDARQLFPFVKCVTLIDWLGLEGLTDLYSIYGFFVVMLLSCILLEIRIVFYLMFLVLTLSLAVFA